MHHKHRVVTRAGEGRGHDLGLGREGSAAKGRVGGGQGGVTIEVGRQGCRKVLGVGAEG